MHHAQEIAVCNFAMRPVRKEKCAAPPACTFSASGCLSSADKEI